MMKIQLQKMHINGDFVGVFTFKLHEDLRRTLSLTSVAKHRQPKNIASLQVITCTFDESSGA